jgi:hypothetical protein
MFPGYYNKLSIGEEDGGSPGERVCGDQDRWREELDSHMDLLLAAAPPLQYEVGPPPSWRVLRPPQLLLL